MKLRMLGNSVRLRLTQGEVSQVRGGAEVRETVQFAPGQRLSYVLRSDAAANAVAASFEAGELVVRLPGRTVEAWADTDQVGIEAEQALGDGDPLRLLIEKDFKCLTPRGEDDGDAFPNPNDTC